MVATLRGKVTEEALLRDEGFSIAPVPDVAGADGADLHVEGVEILVSLGHRQSEAVAKVDKARKRNPSTTSVEELIREVYRAERAET